MTNTPENHAPRPKAERRILSPRECCALAGVSLSTWNRNFRQALPIVKISPRRIGVWADDFFGLMAQRTEPGQPAGAAASTSVESAA